MCIHPWGGGHGLATPSIAIDCFLFFFKQHHSSCWNAVNLGQRTEDPGTMLKRCKSEPANVCSTMPDARTKTNEDFCVIDPAMGTKPPPQLPQRRRGWSIWANCACRPFYKQCCRLCQQKTTQMTIPLPLLLATDSRPRSGHDHRLRDEVWTLTTN